MKKLYETLRDYRLEDGSLPWWNQDGAFTYYDLLELMLSYEFQPYQDFMGTVAKRYTPEEIAKMKLQLQEAGTRWFNGKCSYETLGGKCNGVSANAVFDWLGGMESAKRRYDAIFVNGKDPKNVMSEKDRSPALAALVTGSIISHPDHPEWDIPSRDAPMYWANRSYYGVDPLEYFFVFPKDKSGDPAYLVSLNAAEATCARAKAERVQTWCP